MRRLAAAALVSALTLASCGNAGDRDAFCAAAGEAAEAARAVDRASGAEELREAYEAMDVHIQEMARTAPEAIAGDMRRVVQAWDANLDALDDADYDVAQVPEPEDPNEGDEFAAAGNEVEEFVTDECEVEFDTGPR